MGVHSVEAMSTDPRLTYTSIANFQDGVQLWGDRNYYVAAEVHGIEECEGGTYLQPSIYWVSFHFNSV